MNEEEIVKQLAHAVEQTQLGKSRVTAVTDQHQLGKAKITNGVLPPVSTSIIFLTDGRLALRLANNTYSPL